MFGLLLGFQTFPNLLLFLLLAGLTALWARHYLKKGAHGKTPAAGPDLRPFIILNLLLLFAWARLAGIDMDETEHLHCAWMVSQGLVPLKDFWQHHSPLLWVLLSPVFTKLRPTVFIFELARAFSSVIFAAIGFFGWQIAKKIWQEKARLPLYLLILTSASITGEFLWLRPDLFMILFLVIGIWFFLDIQEDRLSPAFLTGVSFALALSFVAKQCFLVILPPVMILFLDKCRFRVGKLCAYLAGTLIGCAPLLYYLYKKGIFGEFIFWVLQFNRKQLEVSALFPPAILFMGAWGASLLFSRYNKSGDKKSLIFCSVFCLSSLNSLLGIVTFNGGYYLAFWLILCAIAGSGCDIARVFEAGRSLRKKAAIAGLFFAILLYPQLFLAKTHKSTSFKKDKPAVAALMQYCANDTCVLFLPRHPVFCLDATRLYSDWQYRFTDQYACVKEDAKAKNIADDIIDRHPAAVVFRFKQRFFVIELFQKGLISDADCGRLGSFLRANYTVKRIGGEKYYIRNDKL